MVLFTINCILFQRFFEIANSASVWSRYGISNRRKRCDAVRCQVNLINSTLLRIDGANIVCANADASIAWRTKSL